VSSDNLYFDYPPVHCQSKFPIVNNKTASSAIVGTWIPVSISGPASSVITRRSIGPITACPCLESRVPGHVVLGRFRLFGQRVNRLSFDKGGTSLGFSAAPGFSGTNRRCRARWHPEAAPNSIATQQIVSSVSLAAKIRSCIFHSQQSPQRTTQTNRAGRPGGQNTDASLTNQPTWRLTWLRRL
jgi:hypothetical protein